MGICLVIRKSKHNALKKKKFFKFYIATASFDSTIVIWKKKSASDYEVIANLEGHENEVKCTAWSPDGAFLASCSRDKSVWIWDGSLFYLI